MSGVIAEKRLTAAERERMRNLYASGEWLQSDLAGEFGVSRSTVAGVVVGVVRQPRVSRPVSERALPLPSEGERLPIVHMADLIWMVGRAGRRRWWPSVPDICAVCGGRTYLEPPLWDPGRVLCLSCSRTIAEVQR